MTTYNFLTLDDKQNPRVIASVTIGADGSRVWSPEKTVIEEQVNGRRLKTPDKVAFDPENPRHWDMLPIMFKSWGLWCERVSG